MRHHDHWGKTFPTNACSKFVGLFQPMEDVPGPKYLLKAKRILSLIKIFYNNLALLWTQPWLYCQVPPQLCFWPQLSKGNVLWNSWICFWWKQVEECSCSAVWILVKTFTWLFVKTFTFEALEQSLWNIWASWQMSNWYNSEDFPITITVDVQQVNLIMGLDIYVL